MAASAISLTSSRCPILCGSQTGTAFDLAGFFSFEAGKRGLRTQIFDPPSYPIVNLPAERLVFLFVSTTGQGEATSNIKTFWNFLRRKDLPLKASLDGVQFAIFGLGDSSYPRYSYCVV